MTAAHKRQFKIGQILDREFGNLVVRLLDNFEFCFCEFHV
ncbi:hypothetical protein DSM104443_02077 [Usitatibacter rugosus]|uniref:Uncharacterized protein n=1 Tax=Usitatibacter rugosus TaxID=2732067 RepID=A0A6M4GV18_9PROT|nr:hypothetical protein DSM104443_02077 [Usitatibacter rugosus]